MAILSASSTFSRFRVLDPVTDDLILQITDRLRKASFQNIDQTRELRSVGWVAYEDMLDSDFASAPPQKGAYLVFSLRQDTRRIPPAVIKIQVALALKAEKARPGNEQSFIGKERKREIRDQVLLRLRERFLPVPAEFCVIWNLQKNEVWFSSIQSGMIDVFMELFLTTFELHLELLGPVALAESLLGEESADSLQSLEPACFAVGGASHD